MLPGGRVLEPCRGEGAIYKYLPVGADWCEIAEGRDFFAWHEQVDYIVGNPPYNIFADWLRHSFTVAHNIIYLLPVNKIFNSYRILKEIREYGGVKHVRVIGPGSLLDFEVGYAGGHIHLQRDYKGDTSWSWYK